MILEQAVLCLKVVPERGEVPHCEVSCEVRSEAFLGQILRIHGVHSWFFFLFVLF